MTMPSPAFSNPREMQRPSGETGRDLIQKIYESIPWSAPNVRAPWRTISFIEDPSVNPGHSRTPGIMADPIEAAAKNP